MITILAESLERLYKAGRVTQVKVQELLDVGKITQEEYNFIMHI